MAAGLGFKTFTTGEVLTSADVNGYLMQGVLVFASEAARDAAITSPQEGQFAFTKDNNSLWYYSGAAWVASGATGDIEGVTAGTGISGGGTSGTVTITNSMATEIDAKGDLVVGTGADAFARLGVGANGTVLTAASGEATGLQWAAPAAGALTLITTYTASAASSPISFDNCFSSSYRNYQILITGASSSGDVQMKLRNGGTDRTSSVYYYGIYLVANSGTAATQNASASGAWKLCDGSTNKYSVNLTIYAPFISGNSGPNYTALTHSRSSDRGGFNTGFYDTAASSDGFSFHHAGSFTGKISVYGIGE
jgi:hypothetical protein